MLITCTLKNKMKECYTLKFLLCFTFTTHCCTVHLATCKEILSHCTCNATSMSWPQGSDQLWLSGCLPHSSYSYSVNRKWQKKLGKREGIVLNWVFHWLSMKHPYVNWWNAVFKLYRYLVFYMNISYIWNFLYSKKKNALFENPFCPFFGGKNLGGLGKIKKHCVFTTLELGLGMIVQYDLDSSGVRLSVLCIHSLVGASVCALSLWCWNKYVHTLFEVIFFSNYLIANICRYSKTKNVEFN